MYDFHLTHKKTGLAMTSSSSSAPASMMPAPTGGNPYLGAIPNTTAITRTVPSARPLMPAERVEQWRERFANDFGQNMHQRLRVFIGNENEGINLFKTMQSRGLISLAKAKKYIDIIENKKYDEKTKSPGRSTPSFDLIMAIEDPEYIHKFNTTYFEDRLKELDKDLTEEASQVQKYQRLLEQHTKRKRDIERSITRITRFKTCPNAIEKVLTEICEP